MSMVLSFADPAALDPTAVGGKGANLARMTQAELPVPGGFCVTTAAYREVLGEFRGDADAIRARILATPVPVEIAAQIAAAYAAMGEGYVAVRSSGTAE